LILVANLTPPLEAAVVLDTTNKLFPEDILAPIGTNPWQYFPINSEYFVEPSRTLTKDQN